MMLQRLATIAFLLATSTGCSEQPQRSTSINGPQLVIEKPIRDLGRQFLSRQPLTVTFVLENHGVAPLRILEIRPSCQCTTIRLGAKEISPGASAPLELSVDVDAVGDRSASVTLRTNEDVSTGHQIAVHWDAVGPVDIETHEIQFGNVRPAAEAHEKLLVKLLNPDCRIEDVSITPDDLRLGNWQEVESGIELPITLRASSEPRGYSGRLFVHIRGGWPEQMEFPIRWRVREAVEVSPRQFFLGSAKPGQQLRGSVLVTSDDGSSVEIIDVTSTGMTGLMHELEALEHGVRVSFNWTTPNAAGMHRSEVQIAVKDHTAPLVCQAIGYVLPD